MSQNQLLLPPQVCKILQISKRTLQRITQEGKLPSVKIRGSVRYTQSALDELLQSGGVQDDEYRSFLKRMTPIADQATTAQAEWKRGSEALLAFYKRLERVVLDGGVSATLRIKIGEIDKLIAEQQPSPGLLRERRISNGGSGSLGEISG